MDNPRSGSPGQSYFNDLSQQPASRPGGTSNHNDSQNGQASTAKRCAACTLCRKRKLKCDGAKPACATCSRLKHVCSYDEVRKKSGPKRGYVKLLEARLAQVETLLKSDAPPATIAAGGSEQTTKGNNERVVEQDERLSPAMPAQVSQPQSNSTPEFFADAAAFSEETYPWELISLGLDEPLPVQAVVDDLNQIYFDKFHSSLPMIHKPRFYAAMHLAPHTRPPVCLRYAMWCNAAAMTDKYDAIQGHFYHRARKYIQQDEMKGHGESMLTIAHVQTWVLLATYEFKKMYFPRAWMSSGRASRMALMMGLNRLDTSGLQTKQCLPPVRDWTELEERKRTFWSTFCVDRYSSIGTGWPMAIEERDIHTRMPGSEDSFDLSRPEVTSFLCDALEPSGPANLSSFAGVVLMAALFGRNLTHLHRPSPNDQDDDLNGEFWRRHRDLDSILLNISLSLPDELRLPSGLNNSNVIFLNMNIHTSTICLHQAAIFKADTNKNRIPTRISAESKVRCITAAAETASIMRTISHLDMSSMNPFISFCLYVAARVFVQYLRSRPNDHQIGSSLRFLLSAMHAMKRKNPLTESFLVQLDVDLESAGLDSLRLKGKDNYPACYDRSCLQGLVINEKTGPPTYGDQGLAAFNSPNQNVVGRTGNGSADVFGTNGLGIPTRNRMPEAFVSEMDTSPDASGDQLGSGSSMRNLESSRTPSTDYSPNNQQVPVELQVDPMFEPYKTTPAVLLRGVQQPGGAFIPPHDWENGVPPVPPNHMGFPEAGVASQHQQQQQQPQQNTFNYSESGFSALAGGGDSMGDVMAGMTDAEWNSVLESMSGWDSGLDQGSMNIF